MALFSFLSQPVMGGAATQAATGTAASAGVQAIPGGMSNVATPAMQAAAPASNAFTWGDLINLASYEDPDTQQALGLAQGIGGMMQPSKVRAPLPGQNQLMGLPDPIKNTKHGGHSQSIGSESQDFKDVMEIIEVASTFIGIPGVGGAVGGAIPSFTGAATGATGATAAPLLM